MVTYLGSLVQLCCGEGGTLQTNITGVCGECSQCLGHSGFAPTHRACASPVYTAQASGCSAGELSKVGPGFCALPRSKPLRFSFSGTLQRHRLTWGCVLHSSGDHFLGAHSHPQFKSATYPFPRPSSVFWVYNGQALCLFWEADLWLRPSPWMSTVQNPKRSWLATKRACSLVKDASLGP